MPQIANASRKSIQRLLKVLELRGRLELFPGFSHVLGLNSGRLQPTNFDYTNDTLTFRHLLSSNLTLSKLDATVTLSAYLAILEDISTWALLLDRPRRQTARAPGLPTSSVQAEWGPAAQLGMFPGAIVDITATVVATKSTKLNPKKSTHEPLGVVHAEVRDAESGQIICFGSTTKKVPVGGLLKFLVSPVGQWFLGVYAKYMREDPTIGMRQVGMEELFDTSLDFQTHTRAMFSASPRHSSPMGPIHHGCQAILMELVGRQVAQHELAAPWVHLQSIQINYLASVSDQLQIDAKVLWVGPTGSTSIRIELRRCRDTVVASEGILVFSDQMEWEDKKGNSSNNTNTIFSTSHHIGMGLVPAPRRNSGASTYVSASGSVWTKDYLARASNHNRFSLGEC
jgi:acyl-coenzyme A thioesterase PaaI-like protein